MNYIINKDQYNSRVKTILKKVYKAVMTTFSTYCQGLETQWNFRIGNVDSVECFIVVIFIDISRQIVNHSEAGII